MKTVVAGVPVEFKPITVTFTLETQDEVDAFYRAGDEAYRESNCGSEGEKLGIAMKEAVNKWARNA